MGRVLDKINVRYFQEKDGYAEQVHLNEHWQTRARKLKNRKWRELNRKILNDQHVAF